MTARRFLGGALLILLAAGLQLARGRMVQTDEGKPRILCIGAHPDDAEGGAAGSAALWIAEGCPVKFVSVTNGDIGHWKESGPELARRRRAEVEHGAKVVGYDFEILDNHDGELLPTLENRKTITRLIRAWKADVVITHRPNDYHPDHRYTSVLVQDSAYMVTVPKFCPEVPALKRNPVFLYFYDRFQKPYPFQPDIAVAIDSVMEKKLEVLLGMVSQFYEGGVGGSPELLSNDPEKQKARWQAVRERFTNRQLGIASTCRKSLEEWYGPTRAAQVVYAEAFEIGEYGRRPDTAEIKKLFPFFGSARADNLKGAGIRSSTYGRPNDPGPEYWARVGVEIAAEFPGAKPEAIWIASRLKGRGTEMSFPVPPGGDPLITGMPEDISEPVLQLFDKLGYRVWLQTEPGWAPVDEAFHTMLNRYGRHKCVVGVGVDIEWHRSNNPDLGDPVTDEMARTWLAAARSHNPAYRMFLKHFREDVMPPTVRDGILFVDDSQIFKSADEMIDEFAKWGRTFAPAPVGFQYGYQTDKPWWSKMKDPVKEIGDRILAATPNTEMLIWVDFSVQDVFPPDPSRGERVSPKK